MRHPSVTSSTPTTDHDLRYSGQVHLGKKQSMIKLCSRGTEQLGKLFQTSLKPSDPNRSSSYLRGLRPTHLNVRTAHQTNRINDAPLGCTCIISRRWPAQEGSIGPLVSIILVRPLHRTNEEFPFQIYSLHFPGGLFLVFSSDWLRFLRVF